MSNGVTTKIGLSDLDRAFILFLVLFIYWHFAPSEFVQGMANTIFGLIVGAMTAHLRNSGPPLAHA